MNNKMPQSILKLFLVTFLSANTIGFFYQNQTTNNQAQQCLTTAAPYRTLRKTIRNSMTLKHPTPPKKVLMQNNKE